MSDIANAAPVGRIVGLWRYPVKSMGPERLPDVDVGWDGLVGDRRWAFVRNEAVQSGFPWLTLRECSTMAQFKPRILDSAKPDTSTTIVETPSGQEFDVADPAIADALSQNGAHVVRYARGIFDSFPLSLISTQTITHLSKLVGENLDVQRFRPNILVDAVDDAPFQEDDWVGRVLQLGAIRMRVDKRDGRCVVITIDPETGERTPSILKTVRTERQGCLGVYGTTVTPGKIAVNDQVLLV